MIDKLKSVISRYDELAELMSKPDAMRNIKAYTRLAREHRWLTELVENAKKYIDTYNQIKEDEEILENDDLKEQIPGCHLIWPIQAYYLYS